MRGGSFNMAYRLAGSEDDPKHIMRLPMSTTTFPDEKTRGEVAVASFLASKTSIPVASILHHGYSVDNPDVGSYTIMNKINHFWSLSDRLNKRYKDHEARHVLDTNISKEAVKSLDVQMCRFLFQLLQHRFLGIGTLSASGNDAFLVRSRPLTMNMNALIRLANLPEAVLPPVDRTYSTADQWYVACSKMNTAPLLLQQNDFIISADDCKNKLVARLIFHRLAKEGKLSQFGFEEDTWSSQSKDFGARFRSLCPAPSGVGDFVLWCDDLRPGNVLLDDDDRVVGIIDWEFTYVGPAQFALDPPWWLCLDSPHHYDDGGVESFAEIYEERVKIWLEAVREVEREFEPESLRLPHGITLSRYMRESWETGRFWLSYATRKTWAFDEIYWKFLDERFFGKRPDGISRAQLWTTRLDLLTERERDLIEPFVERRLEETKVRKLVDHWDPDEVQRRFNEVLGDDEA